jgi:hypothetical protein
MSRMNFVLALTHQTGRRLAEIGFLLVLFAGIWLASRTDPAVQGVEPAIRYAEGKSIGIKR